MDDTQQETEAPRPSLIRRAGCGVGLIVWFVVMLLPCILITLAVRGEITVNTGGAPEQYVRVWLIIEARERGLGISNAWVAPADDLLCVQTDVNFVLWEGNADSIHYCKCYDPQSATRMLSMTAGVCGAEGE